jgi:predicted ATP-dependent endonuclease of OLD family
MRYKSFRIQNFKGIKDTTINFETIAGASVFPLVGLNESGKTTILEAIHSFSPDQTTSDLHGPSDGVGVPFKRRVPRHLISSFTGRVIVTATLSLTVDDQLKIYRKINKSSLSIPEGSIPSELSFTRTQKFEKGTFKGSFFDLDVKFQVKSGSQRKFREPTIDDRKVIRDAIYDEVPDIAYFPTFIFNFPEKIRLSGPTNKINNFYRRVFQDILDFDGQGHSIKEDIVGRIRSEELVGPWATFMSLWLGHDDQRKIEHIMDRASRAVTRLVFGRWDQIFGENATGKEILIHPEFAEGEIEDSSGDIAKTQEHDVLIKFQIKDGTRRFDVNDRSLGFRWFFAFMLFTQFRIFRNKSRPLLFLFDEPASNLHSAAQQKLLDCFPEIAQGDHTLVYSTHSHYMIDPKWLEQTYIVTNRADTPSGSVLADVSLEDESLDVKATSYRSFVNAHPNQTSYFQPILDRLEVVPSHFDLRKSSVVVEGKSDYFILKFASVLHKKTDLAIMPGLGAGTFGSLVSLQVGWGLDLIFLLDGDAQGLAEKERYTKEYGIPASRLFVLPEIISGKSQIEDLIDNEAIAFIRSATGVQDVTKATIKRFFQERLASNAVRSLSVRFDADSKTLLEGLKTRLRTSK